jgi:hypothetical protein
MNRMDRHGRGGEARLRYLDGDFQVLMTGVESPLDDVKYWSVKRQEAYADAAAALRRYQDTGSI